MAVLCVFVFQERKEVSAMKKFLALFLAIVIAITLVSCLDQKDTPTPAPDASPDGGDTSTTTTAVTTTVPKDYTPKKIGGGSYSGGEFGAPLTASFYSIQEVQEFIKMANGTKEEFEQYRDSNKLLFMVGKHEDAKAMAHNMDIINFPLMSSSLPNESLVITYYLSYNYLDVIYGDGEYFAYRFTYFYDTNTIPEKEGVPVKENVALGPYSLDLYEGEFGRLIGGYLDNSVYVSVWINAQRFGDLPLDVFEMLPIDSIK